MADRELTDLSALTPDAYNANAGTLRGAQILERSLDMFGAARAIVVDREGRVIAGNKTLEHAVDRGLAIKVVKTDGSKLVAVQRLDLEAETPRARQLGYVDNRASELGLAWDSARLAEDLANGVPFGGMFTPKELQRTLKDLDTSGGTTMLLFEPGELALWQGFVRFVESTYARYPPADVTSAAISPYRLAAWVSHELAWLLEQEEQGRGEAEDS